MNIRKSVKLAAVLLLLTAPVLANPAEKPGVELEALPQVAAYIDTGASIENLHERRAAVAEKDVAPLTLAFGPARFTLSGLIEAETSLVHTEGGDEEDDLRLSTVQLGLDAEFTDWLGGHIIGLWEEEDTEPMVVDEAVISLTPPWPLGGQTPALHLGRQYLPFGRFESAMISDPLTLELGETHTTAAVLVLEGARWSTAVGAFEGSVDDGDNGLDSWLMAIELAPFAGVSLGASWISDLAESGAELVQNEGSYRDEVQGWSAFVSLKQGKLGLNAEYLAATKRFGKGQVEAGEDLTGRHPRAWHLELSWQVSEHLQLATRFEEADDYQADVRRYGATASYGLCDYALLAVEYLHADAVGEEPAHAFTAQLALEF